MLWLAFGSARASCTIGAYARRNRLFVIVADWPNGSGRVGVAGDREPTDAAECGVGDRIAGGRRHGVARAPAGLVALPDPLWRPAARSPGRVPAGVSDWPGVGAGRALHPSRSVGRDVVVGHPGAGGIVGMARPNTGVAAS